MYHVVQAVQAKEKGFRADYLMPKRRILLAALAHHAPYQSLSNATISERVFHAGKLAKKHCKHLRKEGYFRNAGNQRGRLSEWKCAAEILIRHAPENDPVVKEFCKPLKNLHERMRGMFKCLNFRGKRGQWDPEDEGFIEVFILNSYRMSETEEDKRRLIRNAATILNRTTRNVQCKLEKLVKHQQSLEQNAVHEPQPEILPGTSIDNVTDCSDGLINSRQQFTERSAEPGPQIDLMLGTSIDHHPNWPDDFPSIDDLYKWSKDLDPSPKNDSN